jgi:hypothetical protein
LAVAEQTRRRGAFPDTVGSGIVRALGLVAVCALALVACGSDDEADGGSSTTAGTSSSDTSSSDTSSSDTDSSGTSGTDSAQGATGSTRATDPEGASELGSLEFELTTANGDVTVTGTSDGCTNPSETTLDVTFTDGTSEVVVSAEDGEGSVIIPGLFEGTIDQIAVGDLGNVLISGRGGLADDSAEPTTFEVLGNCA